MAFQRKSLQQGGGQVRAEEKWKLRVTRRGLRREAGNMEVLIVSRSGRMEKQRETENGSFGRIKENLGVFVGDRREIEDGLFEE